MLAGQVQVQVAAEVTGYRIIYVSLWAVKADPGQALIHEIQAREQ